jgi:NAD+ kinase
VKRVGILYHPLNEAAYPLAEELKVFLGSEGVSAWLCSAWKCDEARAQVDKTDLILTIGGDGTILRAAEVVVPEPIPITGVNLGKLGFMTELRAEEVKTELPALLAGKGWVDERSMLEAELAATEQEAPRIFHALNDVVLARGEIARVVYVETSIDNEPLTTYKADGVMVSTATGSTGYALAAGGPVLHPRAEEFLLVPILPHLSLAHDLVLPAKTVVRLRIRTTHKATLSIDGHINMPLPSGAVVTVKHSPNTIRFLRIHAEKFYHSLEQRFKGESAD